MRGIKIDCGQKEKRISLEECEPKENEDQCEKCKGFNMLEIKQNLESELNDLKINQSGFVEEIIDREKTIKVLERRLSQINCKMNNKKFNEVANGRKHNGLLLFNLLFYNDTSISQIAQISTLVLHSLRKMCSKQEISNMF
jgi:hypothetical protein